MITISPGSMGSSNRLNGSIVSGDSSSASADVADVTACAALLVVITVDAVGVTVLVGVVARPLVTAVTVEAAVLWVRAGVERSSGVATLVIRMMPVDVGVMGDGVTANIRIGIRSAGSTVGVSLSPWVITVSSLRPALANCVERVVRIDSLLNRKVNSSTRSASTVAPTIQPLPRRRLACFCTWPAGEKRICAGSMGGGVAMQRLPCSSAVINS